MQYPSVFQECFPYAKEQVLAFSRKEQQRRDSYEKALEFVDTHKRLYMGLRCAGFEKASGLLYFHIMIGQHGVASYFWSDPHKAFLLDGDRVLSVKRQEKGSDHRWRVSYNRNGQHETFLLHTLKQALALAKAKGLTRIDITSKNNTLRQVAVK